MFKKKTETQPKEAKKKVKLDAFVAPDAKFITMRKLQGERKQWVVEMLFLDDKGNLVVEKRGEPGSRLHAQVQFKRFALEIINAR